MKRKQEDPLYVEYLRERQGEEPFVTQGEKWQFVTVRHPDGREDIGVYRFAGDITYGYAAWRKMMNLDRDIPRVPKRRDESNAELVGRVRANPVDWNDHDVRISRGIVDRPDPTIKARMKEAAQILEASGYDDVKVSGDGNLWVHLHMDDPNEWAVVGPLNGRLVFRYEEPVSPYLRRSIPQDAPPGKIAQFVLDALRIDKQDGSKWGADRASNPIKPRRGESRSEFMARCMHEEHGKFPRQDQRVAVCIGKQTRRGNPAYREQDGNLET
jgi:hypothetical protein